MTKRYLSRLPVSTHTPSHRLEGRKDDGRKDTREVRRGARDVLGHPSNSPWSFLTFLHDSVVLLSRALPRTHPYRGVKVRSLRVSLKLPLLQRFSSHAHR